jgi:hypothetical protein
MFAMRTRLLVVGWALLSSICLTSVASAQTSWWRTYGGTISDWGLAVQQTADGGYIVAGYTGSFGAGNADVYLIKTNAQGNTLWARTYGGNSDDWGRSVQQTADSGYIVVGHSMSIGTGGDDVYLIKANASGDTLWTRTYGGTSRDDGYSVRQTVDGGYIIAGCTYSFGAGYADVYLIRTDPSGDELWTRTYGATSLDWGNSVQQTGDGGYIVVGSTNSFGTGGVDIYLVKTNVSGDTLWTRTYGGTDDDWGNSVQQTLDGGYIVAGYTHSFGAGTPTRPNIYLIKTDAKGDTLWTRTFGGSSDEEGNSVQQTSDGGYVIAGYTESSGAGFEDVYLIKTNAAGDTLWTRTLGGPHGDVGNLVQRTADGGYIIAGFTSSFGAGGADVYLIKTDSSGNVGVAERGPEMRVPSRGPAATVVRSLPQGASAFDAMGRHVLYAKPGIYFLRTTATAAPRKVLLVE